MIVKSLKGHTCGGFIDRLSFTLYEQDAGLEHDVVAVGVGDVVVVVVMVFVVLVLVMVVLL